MQTNDTAVRMIGSFYFAPVMLVMVTSHKTCCFLLQRGCCCWPLLPLPDAFVLTRCYNARNSENFEAGRTVGAFVFCVIKKSSRVLAKKPNGTESKCSGEASRGCRCSQQWSCLFMVTVLIYIYFFKYIR